MATPDHRPHQFLHSMPDLFDIRADIHQPVFLNEAKNIPKQTANPLLKMLIPLDPTCEKTTNRPVTDVVRYVLPLLGTLKIYPLLSQ